MVPVSREKLGPEDVLLVAGDATVNGGALVGVDNNEGKANGSVLGGSSKRRHPLSVTLHQVLVRENLLELE